MNTKAVDKAEDDRLEMPEKSRFSGERLEKVLSAIFV